MEYLLHILRTKGPRQALSRVFLVVERFLFGRRRFGNMLRVLENGSRFREAKITFCVTAGLLEKHFPLLRKVADLGHDIAGHGYIHTNMKMKSRGEQAEMARRCLDEFKRFGITIHGFRCPYLSYNADTIAALEEGPYLWTSNDIIYWENAFFSKRNDYECMRGLSHIYRFSSSRQALSVPRIEGRRVEIPISAPEDEILVDRCGIRDPEAIAKVWLSILGMVYDRGELLHLIFHPERFPFVAEPLEKVISGAGEKAPPVWIASLDEIARWWLERAKCRWMLEQDGAGGWRALIDLPAEGAVLVKGDRGSAGGGFFKDYRPADPLDGGEAAAYFAGRERRFSIGVPESCPPEVEGFLSSEGFIVERSRDRNGHSFYLDEPERFGSAGDWIPLLEAIDASPGPLLRLWRWPAGFRSVLSISSDVDAVTLGDFFERALKF